MEESTGNEYDNILARNISYRKLRYRRGIQQGPGKKKQDTDKTGSCQKN
jgi:hypothetical protein